MGEDGNVTATGTDTAGASGTRRVAVVGGGVSGLTACYRLRQALGESVTIDLFEADDRLGGILHTVEVGPIAVDVGAEAFIVRRPEALDLLDDLGLADRVVSPTARRPAVWAAGRLHDLPRPALMGIPADADAVSGLASAADLERIAAEPDRPWNWTPGDDISVGELVSDRFGPTVVARSVDPMLGGVYSSLAADIGVREALPALAAEFDGGAPGLRAAVAALTGGNAGSGPVFGTLPGGYRVLVDALVADAQPQVHLGSPVTAVHRDGDRWALRSGHDEVEGDYDGVIITVAAWLAARLLADVAPESVTALRDVEQAPSAVVSITLDADTELPDHSGVLVATGEDLHAKAFTFSSQKWAHLGEPGRPRSVRASFGRYGDPVPDEGVQPGIDARLRELALADLDTVCADAGVAPPSSHVIDTRVQRWTLPRYAPGHLAAMSQVLAATPDGIELAGCSYGGVGVPACIGQAGRAVTGLLAHLN